MGGLFGGLLQRVGGLSRTVLGIGLGAILVLLVAGYLLNQAGNNGDEERTPEPPAQNVFGPPGSPGGAQGPSTPTPGPSTAPAEPTARPTEERQRGGDNRRNEEETPEGGQAPEGILNPGDTDVALALPPFVPLAADRGASTLAPKFSYSNVALAATPVSSLGDGTGAATPSLISPDPSVMLAATPVASLDDGTGASMPSGDSPDPSAVLATTPVAVLGDGTGAPPIAQDSPAAIVTACPQTCLLRVAASPSLDATLTEAGTRPSFVAGTWSWVVASSEGAGLIASRAATTLVSPTVNTLNAYVVRVPEGQTDDAAVAAFGRILDVVDDYRVVEVAKVPALVTPLTDNGYEVFKMAPAPVPVTLDTRERMPLASIDIGELLDEVKRANLQTTVRELQGTSSTDGSGIGTRFYSLTGNAIACEYLFQQMEALGMNVWYEDFLTPDGLLLVNVVGEVPGADPSAVYGVMAHLDSISTDTGNAPGADDNATGIASSLEIARILSGYELKHPVRLIFVNGEEVGILGSESWARKIVADDVPVEGVFNIDSVGSERQGELIWLNTDAESAWMTELIIEINGGYGLGQDLATRQNPNIVADDNKVREQGIAAVMVARELYGMSPLHHTPDDLIEAVSFDNTQTTTQLVLLAMATLVQ
jgi:hypothetical protein